MAQRAASGLANDGRSNHRSGRDRPSRSGPATSRQPEAGFHPPQQARSRAALQRLLASAEQVLINEGPEDFTIARVAEHAGVSVGGVYRRFASKEQLIDAIRFALMERLEEAVADALDNAGPSLNAAVEAFTAALGKILNESGRVIPAILAGGHSANAAERGPQAIGGLQQRFVEAASSHQDQIRHPDPQRALNVVFRSVIAAGAHRAAISPWLPDGLTWIQWAREMADMATAYLTFGRQSTSSAL